MTDERWRHVQVLFEEALTRPPPEREAFVAEACGDDADLRAEVASLLACDGQAPPEFLHPPEPDNREAHTDVQASDEDDPLIGTRISRYLIKRVIASGGMGTVYEARQDLLERPVALKVLRTGRYSKAATQRFEFESQILARLRHHNVAQVYEAGTHTPEPRDSSRAVPYFAMEYIPGASSITDYATDKNLTTRDRLAMFAKVCDAVHHGHQKGIIHRDLKPANILVDSSGVPKVIEFGGARATDSDLAITTQQTKVGQLIGTMQYMSPEQCEADPHDLDTRTDVYSLGVVLFELLTGELPYEASGTTIYQATVAIREQAPRRLSTINPKLRGDVEIITLKALAKDRERRYQSAADLAADIQRYLNREPIEAKRPTAWTRAARWIGRHPIIATAAACFVVGILAGATSALVSHLYLSVRPYDVYVADGGHEARLIALSGAILHTWPAGRESGITFADLVERPTEFGGGDLALLGFHFAHGRPFPRSLCAFEAGGDLERSVWHKRIESGDIPDQLRTAGNYVGDSFAVRLGAVFDVFPERPGDEVVAVHGCAHSPRAIRIYDLDGNLLYQVWHDGSLNSCRWMADAGLLVFTGLNSEVDWDERGYRNVVDPHPMVVFAIRPEIGMVRRDLLLCEAGTGPWHAAWYKCLLPPGASDKSDNAWRLASPVGEYDSGTHVTLSMQVDDHLGAGIWWVVDQDGIAVPGSCGWGDSYRRNLDRLPDPEYFHLGPLPPVVTESRETE